MHSIICMTMVSNQSYQLHLNDTKIVPFHKDFSPSGEQLEHRKLAPEL